MTQLLLFLGIHVIGVCLGLAFGLRPWLCVATGFMTGLCAVVVTTLAVVLLKIHSLPVLSAALAAVLIGSAIAALRTRPSTRTLAIVTGGSAAYALLCAPFCLFNLSILTYDSYSFLVNAFIVGDTGELVYSAVGRLGTMQVLSHSLWVLSREEYLYALPAAFSLSFVASFALLLGHALTVVHVTGRTRTAVVAFALAVLFSSTMFRMQTVYLHANLSAAAYLVTFLGAFWLAETTRERAYAPLAFVLLLGFTWQRVEAPAFAVIFLLLTVGQSRLPRAVLLRSFTLYTVAAVAWGLYLARHVDSKSVFLTPAKSILCAAALAGVYVFFLLREHKLIARIVPRVPWLLLFGCVAAIAVVWVFRAAILEHWIWFWKSLLRGRYWGYFWWGTLVTAFLGLWVKPPPFSTPFVFGILLYFGLVFFLAATGTDFGTGMLSGLSRVTFHILPTVTFYFALKFAPLLRPAR